MRGNTKILEGLGKIEGARLSGGLLQRGIKLFLAGVVIYKSRVNFTNSRKV